jgi:hypothetical protein
MLKRLSFDKRINRLYDIMWYEGRKVEYYCSKKDWNNVAIWLFKKKCTAKALNIFLNKRKEL